MSEERFLGWFTKERRMRLMFIGGGVFFALVLLLLVYAHLFGPRDTFATTQEFLVTPDEQLGNIADTLVAQGYVRSGWAFEISYLRAAAGKPIRPGGYRISASMDAWSLGSALANPPYLAYIRIPNGARKEQIGDLLATTLSWSLEQKRQWSALSASAVPGLADGVYYPDVYLIPTDQTPAQIASRLYARFLDSTAPQAKLAAVKGLSWPTVLTLASLVEREAAKNDKALVAGVLWNRLHVGMPLAVDATLQYMQGKSPNWWPAPNPQEKYIPSPFNTYKNTGLPPYPIAEPSLASINAVLSPTKTSCLFYLHDNDGTIHCSPTYKGHLANVNKYLK